MLVFIGERVPSVATVMMGLINALHQSQVKLTLKLPAHAV